MLILRTPTVILQMQLICLYFFNLHAECFPHNHQDVDTPSSLLASHSSDKHKDNQARKCSDIEAASDVSQVWGAAHCQGYLALRSRKSTGSPGVPGSGESLPPGIDFAAILFSASLACWRRQEPRVHAAWAQLRSRALSPSCFLRGSQPWRGKHGSSFARGYSRCEHIPYHTCSRRVSFGWQCLFFLIQPQVLTNASD